MDKLRSFSRQHRLNGFRGCAHGLASQIRPADLPTGYSYTLAPGYPTPGPPIFLRPSIALHNKYRNINLFSIGYGFHPHLRIRLTLGRLPLPRKPRVFGEYVFHIFYRYSCQHNHFTALRRQRQMCIRDSSKGDCQSFGTMLSPVTFSAQSH